MRRSAIIALLVSLLSLTGCLGTPSEDQPDDLESQDSIGDLAPLDFPRPTVVDGFLGECAGPLPAPIEDFQVRSVPALSEPAPREPFRDPVFGTCMVRVTDRTADLPPDDPSPGLKNEYSRVQSFNADGSLILVRSLEARWYVYDATTLQPLAEVPAALEPRWDADDPAGLFTIDGTRLWRLDLAGGVRTLVHDFADDLPSEDLAAVWTRYEGSPSADGHTWGLLAQDQDWRPVALLVYDALEDRLLAQRPVAENASIDSVTISPLGTYLLVYHDEVCPEGAPGSPDQPCGLMVYDRLLQEGRSLLPIVGHSDTALDADTREVLVFQDIQRDEIAMLDLATGQITPLLTIDFSHSPLGFHFSGRALRRPGWVVVSTYSGAQPSATWMDDQVFVVELVPGGRVIRLAHTHSIVDERQEHDYWAEPHASTNLDLTQVLFTSNWGRSGSGEVEMFAIQVPEAWFGTPR